MKFKSIKYIVALFAVFFTLSCSKDDTSVNTTDDTAPSISSLTTDKSSITFGEDDPATITCSATGGNLKYVWQVDLGDIQPLNSDKSKIKFTGSACCVGDKIINCTVSNSKGSVTKSITLKILEKITIPEIISIQSDNAQMAANTTAILTCNALGGNLKYSWEVPCGTFTYKNADSSKIAYTPSANCVGTQTIKCTVTNEKGSVYDTFVMTVTKK